ncbi:hypothetical protein [Staphylococcus durrellii]|uniref:hypothetical protein n=1 Tax=Staphylococcus durrellii TaxID=2781773 RepID=UPI0018A11EE8|nr:hypothetical protein [Staphylococcus durrellii]MBF7016071.1 hypothetical protein [Staphylococcus durrellii]
MKPHQEIFKYSIRKLAKGAGVLLISSVLLCSMQNSAFAAENNQDNQRVNNQGATHTSVKAEQKKDTTNPEIQSIKMDKREYAPGEIAIATLIVKDASNLADASIGFSNTTQVGAPALSGVADKENIEKIGDGLWKVTIQIHIPDKIGTTLYNFSAAIVDDEAQNGTTIAPELAPTSLNTKDLSFKVVNKSTSNIDTELPQFDSVTVDKQTYAPGDVIKAQLKISDKSTLKEVSVGFENYPDKGLIGLSKVADLSNVQRNSEGQWVVNVDIPVPNDLEDGSYKFSHISATDEFGNAFGLIDVPDLETKFHNVKFNVAKSGNDKATVAPMKPQANDQNKDTDNINKNTTDSKKSDDIDKKDNNVTMQEQPRDNNANKSNENEPQDSGKSTQNKDVVNTNVENNSQATMKDKAADNTTEPKSSEAPEQSKSNDSKVAPQNEAPKAHTPITDSKVEPVDAPPSQQKSTAQPNDVTSTKKAMDKSQPQIKGDTSKDNNVQAMPQDKNASNSTAKDVNNKSQTTDKKLADTKSSEPKVDKQSNVDNVQKGTNAEVKTQEQKEQPMQSQSKDNKHQQVTAKSQMQNKATQGNAKAQSTTKQQPNNKMQAEMPKQATAKSQMQDKATQGNAKTQSTTKQQPNNKMQAEMPKQAIAKSQMQNKVTQGNAKTQSTTKQQPNNKMQAETPKQTTTKVADNAKSIKTQHAANNKAVATQSKDKATATDKNKRVVTDKQKQTTSKDKANKNAKDAKSAKQLPKTGMMDAMRDYFFIGVLMAVGITVIMFRRFSVFK